MLRGFGFERAFFGGGFLAGREVFSDANTGEPT